jgi:hypothetical protein
MMDNRFDEYADDILRGAIRRLREFRHSPNSPNAEDALDTWMQERAEARRAVRRVCEAIRPTVMDEEDDEIQAERRRA